MAVWSRPAKFAALRMAKVLAAGSLAKQACGRAHKERPLLRSQLYVRLQVRTLSYLGCYSTHECWAVLLLSLSNTTILVVALYSRLAGR